ncbi:MAG: nitrate reductase subunit alpha [Actinobacteria bacterium]|nr:nitrate reductase subunit alpha [Actinomycetota bacterium]
MNDFGLRSLLVQGTPSEDNWSLLSRDGRKAEDFYRKRWAHDKVVRSTHGVNCTGSCSWNVYVKDGIITWETQAIDYPSNGPTMPEYEPRGCPRGASFSWYIYSPNRVRFPYVRGALLELYREERRRTGDPVEAWAAVVSDPEKKKLYTAQRGKGGFVRAGWDEAAELVAAAHVHTVKQHGPDRIFGFSPIPAMSMASYSAGTRFLSLIGGACLSFYDWYCDLPPASPQVWGDQTDVPESADWWNAGYLMMWGSNVPMTRTPDAHFMTEARYRGQKTVVVSPDYSDHTKFADHWLPANPGTDGALAMAMGHVMLKEFYVDRETPYFSGYAKQFTDLPHLVRLEPAADGDGYVAGRFLRASDLGAGDAGGVAGESGAGDNGDWKTVLFDAASGELKVPKGTIGDRWGEAGEGNWNLELDGVDPALTLLGVHDDAVTVSVSVFGGDGPANSTLIRRGVPAKRLDDGTLVATVLDLTLAQYGVGRDGLPGDWPKSYEDDKPFTPAWQQLHTGVPAADVIKVAREFARNAERTQGRSMIVMGAGTNHWYHGDTIYRAMLNLVLLAGCQGKNGGGWAHYVGQEKVRPIAGFSQVAFALDWARPPRHQAATSFFYMNTSQFRYDPLDAGAFRAANGPGSLEGHHVADCVSQAVRMGWTPAYPSLNRNPLDLADEAEAAGVTPAEHIVGKLKDGGLGFAWDDPDDPGNFPRVLTVWRANLIAGSAKGHEYFLKNLLGVTTAAVRNEESAPENRPKDVAWHEQAPDGKLDLLTTLDFRMNGTGLHSDIVLPTATWYEKHDISSTDMHPFVHPFNPAISPPWEARTDWDIFKTIAHRFSRMAETHLGTRTDVVMVPLQHDTPDEIAQPFGEVRDWKAGECEAVPGVTMPKFIPVARDYPKVFEQMVSLGPLAKNLGLQWKGVSWNVEQQVGELARANGAVEGPEGPTPSFERAAQLCEGMLYLSGTTNGHLAVQGWETLGKRVGRDLTSISADREDELITFDEIQHQPRKVIASAEWSGLEGRDRRYSPFTANIDHLIPFRTLTGRQHFYLDHEWMRDYGEGLATYRPPVDLHAYVKDPQLREPGRPEVVLRFITPHSKWSIHSTYQDNLTMLTLSRGGPVLWINHEDAESIGVADNDWIELFNRNGVVACRAAVSHRIQKGMSLMYHVQDRHVNVPKTELTGTRGGIHNSLTRINVKPTHLIGGYAQLSYGFNYYGPTGNQRDELIVVRRRVEEVTY